MTGIQNAEEIAPEAPKLATITVRLTGGIFDKTDKWIAEEDITENVLSWGIQCECLLMTKIDGSTVGIPLSQIEKFEIQGQ